MSSNINRAPHQTKPIYSEAFCAGLYDVKFQQSE